MIALSEERRTMHTFSYHQGVRKSVVYYDKGFLITTQNHYDWGREGRWIHGTELLSSSEAARSIRFNTIKYKRIANL